LLVYRLPVHNIQDGVDKNAPLAHMLRAYYDREKGISQKASEFIMVTIPLLAYMIDWGWLRIGPPYIYININPVIFTIGPLSLRWYGLMYAVAIFIGLQVIRGYTARKGISQTMVYRILWWCVVAGLLGGRLYFVVQQPNFFSYYLTQPQHILATWEGGMAFFGAIFLVIPTLIWRARVERLNPLVLIDAGVLFAAAGQIFGRIGNLINGDIIGYPSTLPWSTVYQHPNSWACLNPSTCNVPVQPAAGYELLTNLVLLAVMLYLARRLTRPGVLMLVYLYSYALTQFLLFFTRDNLVVSFLGLNWGLKQAQWTSLVLFVVLLPLTYLVLKYSKPVPEGEVAATYGIPQRKKQDEEEQQDQDAKSEVAGATEGTGGEVAKVQEATGDVEARGM
jgi:phosphatidylglycerol---prolipoprotein diacylglyceryl transferase